MIPPPQRFEHPAMNTLFTVRMHCGDRRSAAAAAGMAFRLLEELEAALSRFRPDSEISRINALQAGESLLLSELTRDCLAIAFEAGRITDGLFEIALPDPVYPDGTDGAYQLDPDRPRITCIRPGRRIDVGGIGKGFALDRMAAVLRELGIASALISAGDSTHLATGPDAWEIAPAGSAEPRRVALRQEALSTSGLDVQGAHIVHPDTGAPPPYAFRRVWVRHASAALADACSTACMVMDAAELDAFSAARAADYAILTLPRS